MIKTTKDYKLYNAQKLAAQGNNRFTHSVKMTYKHFKVTSPPSSTRADNIWFLKKTGSKVSQETLFAEILSQELFRMLMPNNSSLPRQPKTRVLVSKEQLGLDSQTKYIASKKINFTPLADMSYEDLAAGVESGKITGLGQIQVLSLATAEIDLKTGNIGLNENNEVVKIDGDWSFAEFKYKHNRVPKLHVSSKTIESLPYLNVDEYQAHNWLDQKLGGKHAIDYAIEKKSQCLRSAADFDQNFRKATSYSEKEIAHKQMEEYLTFADEWDTVIAEAQEGIFALSKLTNSVLYRQEVNSMLLKILLVPQEVLLDFVKAYIPAAQQLKIDKFYQYLIARQDMLFLAAIKSDSFISYMQSEDAVAEIAILQKQLYDFIPHGKTPLVNAESNHVHEIPEIFAAIKQACTGSLDCSSIALSRPSEINAVENAYTDQSNEILYLDDELYGIMQQVIESTSPPVSVNAATVPATLFHQKHSPGKENIQDQQYQDTFESSIGEKRKRLPESDKDLPMPKRRFGQSSNTA